MRRYEGIQFLYFREVTSLCIMTDSIEKIGTNKIKNTEFSASLAGDVARLSLDMLNDDFDILENLAVTDL
ncbi:MAG: hypothetical protein IJ058_03505 [Lachnospiraceae bacterium]|nr:hypothetical protein [Lachnospiraceae bacterium]